MCLEEGFGSCSDWGQMTFLGEGLLEGLGVGGSYMNQGKSPRHLMF